MDIAKLSTKMLTEIFISDVELHAFKYVDWLPVSSETFGDPNISWIFEDFYLSLSQTGHLYISGLHTLVEYLSFEYGLDLVACLKQVNSW